MKSIARSSCVSAALTAILFSCPIRAQQQTAQCTDPPGGTITCAPNQLAICAVNKGKVEGRCVTPPPSLKTKEDVRAWVLGQVTDREISPAQANDKEFRKALESGAWHAEGRNITFSFSEKLFENLNISDIVTGEIKQQGRNNINQLGNNNQATVNSYGSPSRVLSPESLDKFKAVLASSGVRGLATVRKAGSSDDIDPLVEQLDDALERAGWGGVRGGTVLINRRQILAQGIECYAADWNSPDSATIKKAMEAAGLKCTKYLDNAFSLDGVQFGGTTILVGRQ